MSLLRRSAALTSSGLIAGASTVSTPAAASSSSITACGGACCNGLAEQRRGMHGPTTNNTVRSQHNKNWLARTKNHMITGRDSINTSDRPGFPGFAEDVDRPMVMPDVANCFVCKADMHAKSSMNDFVWIPSGNAATPGPQGYFFCKGCFRCAKCKFRFIHNKFYTVKGEAVCIRCALGREVLVPSRRWHTSFVGGFNKSSRITGQSFPRYQHQLEFLYSPEK